jgi:uncharacterized protein (DUF2147 family)
MKKCMLNFAIAVFLAFCSFPVFSLPSSANIIGSWVTRDLQNIPRSIVKINSANGNTWGTIIKILPTKGQKPTDLCTKCIGTNFNKPKQGMMIIWGLTQQNSGEWKGKILDTDGGNVYSCQITTSADNQVLHLHAYKGIPILGATVNWNRAK